MIRFLLMLVLTTAVFSYMTVGALDITIETNGGASVTADTELRNQPTFTVNIPSTIPMENISRAATEGSYSKNPFNVSISEGSQLGDKSVVVAISVEGEGFYLYYDQYKLPYEVKLGDTVLKSGDTFATFTASNTAIVNGEIVIDRYDIPAEGTYSGTLIFTVSVEAPTT